MTGIAAILRFPLADIDESRATEETVAEASASSSITTVDKLTSSLTSASIQSNSDDNKKGFKKVDNNQTAPGTPNKKAQKPAPKVNNSKKGNKYDYGDENDDDDYYDDDEYDDYY